MDLRVSGDGFARFGDRIVRCAIGHGGLRLAKSEGDGATPIGAWPLRTLFYRADREPRPTSGLPPVDIGRYDGWCDDPADENYNRPVKLPYTARAEQLWREDTVYDLIVPLGYNDAPVIAGRGSAIFLHVARATYLPTEGCVALARQDLLTYLALAGPGSRVIVGL